MAVLSSEQLKFGFLPSHCVLVQRSGEQITSDAGLLPVRQFDQQWGYTARMAACLTDPKARRRRCTVNWYGGQTRRIEWISDEGHWYRAGRGLVALRWVFVHDVQGTHRDEYFYCTDPELRPAQIVSLFTTRWSIEVTFQEVRAHLGFNTPRNWSAKSVLRTVPCLLGLFSVISLLFAGMTRQSHAVIHASPWYHKKEITFSDAITAVRRLCWQEVFQHPPLAAGVDKLSKPFRFMLLGYLSRAA